MYWACISLPQLALDDALRRGHDRDTPLILVSGAGSRAVVRAATQAAVSHGVRLGQSLVTARALCPRVTLVEYDPGAVNRCHDLLAAWAYGYSSLVSRELGDVLLLEVQASFNLFGGWRRLCARLQQELDGLGFQYRIALAPNPMAAKILAEAENECALTDHRLLLEVLRALPVTSCGLPESCASHLQRMGLRKLHQVFALPRAELGKRIGPEALLHLDRLRGELPTPLACYRPPDAFDQRIELAFNTGSGESLLFPLRRIVRDFAAFLSGRDAGAQRFTLGFEHEHGPPTEIRIGLLTPERDPDLLFDIAHQRLDRVQLSAPVCGVRLRAEELPTFTPLRRALFDVHPQQAVTWEVLRERLRARLGEQSVHGLGVHADHRPERAWKVVDGTDRVDTAGELPLRPAWLLTRPIPLRDSVMRILAGPERIESGWWDGADVRRDYYVVETGSHQRAWAFRPAGDQGPFMLHGWFA